MLTVSIIGAFAVFFSVLSYVDSVSSQVGPTEEVLRLRRDVAAHEVVRNDDLETVTLPSRWVSGATVSDPSDVVGQVAKIDQPAGAIVQVGMFGDLPVLKPGEVEHSILIDADTGVGGTLRAGDNVQMWVAYTDENKVDSAAMILTGRVLRVGVPTFEEDDRREAFEKTNSKVPVILALNARDAGCVTWAESFAKSVRLTRVLDAGNGAELTRCPAAWTNATAPGTTSGGPSTFAPTESGTNQ